MATADNRGTGKDKHGGKGMRDRALELVPQQSEVDGYVIQVDSDGRNETRDIKPTRHIDEARQDEQAQSPGGQMADFVEQASTQNAERNRAVGCVESQRHPRQQYRIGPQPDRAPAKRSRLRKSLIFTGLPSPVAR